MGNYMHHCTIRWQHPKTTSTTFYFLPMYFKQGVPRTRNASFLRDIHKSIKKTILNVSAFSLWKIRFNIEKERWRIWNMKWKKITTKKVSRCVFYDLNISFRNIYIDDRVLILDYYMDRFKRNYVSTFYNRYFWRIL